jgi:hypothetical protein
LERETNDLFPKRSSKEDAEESDRETPRHELPVREEDGSLSIQVKVEHLESRDDPDESRGEGHRSAGQS